MTIWRMVLVVAVAVLAGFVGGVWFIASGLAFHLIQLPAVPTASNGRLRIEYIPLRIPEAEMRGGPSPRTSLEVQPIGVPDPAISGSMSGGLVSVMDRDDLRPTPGCLWEVFPSRFRIDQEWHTSNAERLLVGVPTIEPSHGLLRIVLTQTTRSREDSLALRAVFFDVQGNRYPARVSSRGYLSGGGGYVEFSHHEWDDLTPSNPRQIAYFGVERVVPDSVRLAAEAARAEAKQQGIDLLPPPRIGEPFDFDLPTADGQRVRSADLRGKAVLVVICGPPPLGPMRLQEIRQEYGESKLAVVAISFAATLDQTDLARKNLGEPTSLVVIPNDPLHRRLWREGAEISRIPSYWFIDPAGVLRLQGRWFDLADRLTMMLGPAARQQMIEANSKTMHELNQAEREAWDQAKPGDNEANTTKPDLAPPVASPHATPPDGSKD